MERMEAMNGGALAVPVCLGRMLPGKKWIRLVIMRMSEF